MPVSTISQWCVRWSKSTVVILASPKTDGHSPNARLVVTITELCPYQPADEVEQKLAVGLGEGQIAEHAQDNEVPPSEIIGEMALATGPRFDLKFINPIDVVEGSPARAAADDACPAIRQHR